VIAVIEFRDRPDKSGEDSRTKLDDFADAEPAPVVYQEGRQRPSWSDLWYSRTALTR
jgi:hypothetical protein